MKVVKPHVLLGLSTHAGAFTEEIVREMSRHVESPIIMPLSNPSRLHEAQPDDLNVWSNERVLIATGSPFPPVQRHGSSYEIGELTVLLAISFANKVQPNAIIRPHSPALV